MNKPGYQHLFFDLDHTLWDFEANSRAVIDHLFVAHELEEKGIFSSSEFFHVFSIENEKLWARYRSGFMRQDELRVKRFRNTLLHFRIADEKVSKALAEEYIEQLPHQVNLLPYARELLIHCEVAGYQMHIITNGFEEVQFKKMESSGIDSFFKEVITSERCMSLKPKREIFDYALQASGAHISESIMIGDNWEADIAGAINAGWDQVYYNPGKLEVQGNTTFHINCLSEMLDIF